MRSVVLVVRRSFFHKVCCQCANWNWHCYGNPDLPLVGSQIHTNLQLTKSGGAAWLTAEEESDRISMKKTNYIKSTLLSLLKVCLYGCYTNCQFYQISHFCELNIVFCKISENNFLRIAY